MKNKILSTSLIFVILIIFGVPSDTKPARLNCVWGNSSINRDQNAQTLIIGFAYYFPTARTTNKLNYCQLSPLSYNYSINAQYGGTSALYNVTGSVLLKNQNSIVKPELQSADMQITYWSKSPDAPPAKALPSTDAPWTCIKGNRNINWNPMARLFFVGFAVGFPYTTVIDKLNFCYQGLSLNFNYSVNAQWRNDTPVYNMTGSISLRSATVLQSSSMKITYLSG